MKECWAFVCLHSKEGRYGENICYYTDELCDIPYLNRCPRIDTKDLCNICQKTVFCGLKEGEKG